MSCGGHGSLSPRQRPDAESRPSRYGGAGDKTGGVRLPVSRAAQGRSAPSHGAAMIRRDGRSGLSPVRDALRRGRDAGAGWRRNLVSRMSRNRAWRRSCGKEPGPPASGPRPDFAPGARLGPPRGGRAGRHDRSPCARPLDRLNPHARPGYAARRGCDDVNGRFARLPDGLRRSRAVARVSRLDG